ncbi:MAG: hypothetical protein C0509_08745 [Acinetobacter sp.]|nr:hypothetical protein [Acinetobacter sp.]
MTKTIRLCGDLEKFKPQWQLHVKTPGEALRAIECNRPGFLAACDAGDYLALLIDADHPENTRQITMADSDAPWGGEVMVIVPRIGGELPAAFIASAFSAIGVTLPAASFALAAVTAVINIGLSLAFSALANIITGNKQSVSAVNQEQPESRPSFVANGAVNVTSAGHPYPIIAGEFLCGSIVLSSNLIVNDIPV